MSGETKTLRVVIVGDAKDAQRAVRSLTGDLNRSERTTRGIGAKLGMTFAAIGASAALGFGIAAAAAGRFVYKVGADYEQSLSSIQALTDSNQKTMEKAAKQLEASSDAYAKMGLTVGDAASGVVELTKAGMNLNQSLKAVNGTMVLARAGQLDVADASALVSNTINTFGLKADAAARIANVLANAANISSADVSDLGMSLSMVGNVAAGAGLSIEQVSAMLAELANKGMKGSDAGTSLKTMLLRLTAPTAVAKKELEGLGVAVFDAEGKMRPFKQIMKDMVPALDRLTDEERAAKMKKIFGDDAFRAAKVVFGSGTKMFEDYTKGVGKAGAAQKLAEARTVGLSGAFARLKASVTSNAQGFYREISPALGKFVNDAMDTAGKLKAKVGPALKEAFSGAGNGNAGAEFSKTFAALKSFGASMLPTLKKLGSQIMGVLGPAFKEIGGMIVNDLLPAFRQFLPAIQPVAKFLLNILGGAVIGVLKGLVLIVKGVLNVISGLFKVISGVLTGDWSKAWEGLKQILKGALQAIWGAIQVWWNAGILGIFKKGALALLTSSKGLWTGLKNLFAKGMAGLTSLLMKIVNVLTMPFRKGFTAVKNYVVSGWKFVIGKFTGGLGSLKSVLGRLIEVITYPYRQAFSIAKGIITGGWNTARSAFSTGVTKVMNVVRDLPSKIKGAFSGAVTWLRSAGADIVRGLGNGLDDMWDWVMGKIRALTDKIPGWVKKKLGIASPSKVMAALGRWGALGLAKGFGAKEALKAGINNVGKLVDGITATVAKKTGKGDGKKSPLSEKGKKAKEKLKEIQKAQNELAESIKSAFKDLFSSELTDPAQVDRLVKRFRDGFLKRITKMFNKGQLSKGMFKGLKRELGDAAKEMRQILKDRIALMAQLETAQTELNTRQERLNDLIAKRDDLVASVSNAAKSHGSLMGVLGDGSAEQPQSAQAILSRLKDKLANIKNFAVNIKKLAGMGIGNQLLNEIAAAGPDEGGAMAAALLGMPGGDLSEFKNVMDQINAESDALGAWVGDNTYKADIDAATQAVADQQTVVNNVTVQVAGNVAAEKDLAESIATIIRDVLARDDKRNGTGTSNGNGNGNGGKKKNQKNKGKV